MNTTYDNVIMFNSRINKNVFEDLNFIDESFIEDSRPNQKDQKQENEEQKDVFQAISVFLDGYDSKNTRNNYERHIRNFFKEMRNKDIEHLTEEDLIFNHFQIDSYRVELRKKYKTKTVNAILSSLKNLYEKLEVYEFKVKASWFKVKRYDETDTQSWDTLSHDEVVKIIKLVSKTRKGFEKSLLLRVAYATAFRLSAILNLKWSDLINKDGVWYLKAIDKGEKRDIKKISNELYNLLMKHKENSNGEKIFSIQRKTIYKMLNYIRKNMDFGERVIVFHSFKKASIDEVNIITQGDIKAMQRHGNHSSAQTTLDIYTKKADLENLVVIDIDYKLPLEEFDKLSHEDLLDLVKNSDRNIQIKLLQKMGAI